MAFLLFFVLLNSVFSTFGIFGGQIANEGEFPHHVQLLIQGQYFCGGTIISPDHVLTAAHCLQRLQKFALTDEVVVVAGSNKRLDWKDNKNVWDDSIQVRLVSNYTPHPNYDANGLKENDIGILTLQSSFVFTKKVNSIPLIKNGTLVYPKIIIPGWGEIGKFENQYKQDKLGSPVLKKVEQMLLSKEDFHLYHIGHFKGYPKGLEELLCAKTHLGHGLCNGDSGGGVLCTIYPEEFISVASFPGECLYRLEKVVCGIVAFGENVSCGRGLVDSFTNVQTYSGWIQQVTTFQSQNLRKNLRFELKCDGNHFYCPTNRTCIERGKLCNMERDCAMGEDELGQGCILNAFDCKKSEFRCSNGRCLKMDKQCNGINDCHDSEYSPSDEEKCAQVDNIGRRNCSENFYDCGGSDRCIPNEWKCDQTKDCENGSDEELCGLWEKHGPESFWGWMQLIGSIEMIYVIIEQIFRLCRSGIKETGNCYRLLTLDWF